MQWQTVKTRFSKEEFFRRFDKSIYLDSEEMHEKHFEKEAFFGKCNNDEFYINLHFPSRKYFYRFIVVGKFINDGFSWKIKLNPSFMLLAQIWLIMLLLVILFAVLLKWWIFMGILIVGLVVGLILMFKVSSEIKIKYKNIIEKITK